MKFTSSGLTALAIAGVIIVYFTLSALFRPDAAQDEDKADARLFSVVTEKVAAQPWRDEILVRGRTEALRKVIVRAETPGAIAETPAEPGAVVKKGDSLCRINVDARRAAVSEARAAYAKARLDYDAGAKLAEEGFRSKTSLAALKASLDLASAGLEQARLTLAKTNITAPFNGIFDDRLAEVGDYLKIGDPCGIVIQKSPFLVSGAVSERDVSKIKMGDPGQAQLATGEKVAGKIRYVAVAADDATRTFKVELEVPNEDGAIKDGVTADFVVFASQRDAHLAPRSALTLDEIGRIGVRSVNAGGRVETHPVQLLGETANGVWLDGLDGDVTLITRGQEYVSTGQEVQTVDRSTLDPRETHSAAGGGRISEQGQTR